MAQGNEAPDTLPELTLFDMDTVQHSGDLDPEQGQELAVTDLGTLRNDAVSGTLPSAPASPAELFNNEPSTPTREPRVFFDNFRALLKTHRREFSLGVATVTLAGLIGGALFLKNSEAPEPRAVVATQPIVAPTPAPTPIETVAPFPTNLPTATSSPETSSVPTPEKGSVEYYQVTVKDNPTTADAVAGFGKLSTLFVMSGKYDSSIGGESAKTIYADDNMLVAFFGENPEANHPAMVAAWRKTRVVLSRSKMLIAQMTNNVSNLEYEMAYTPVGDPPAPGGVGDTVSVEVLLSSTTNVNQWFPNANFQNKGDWNMTLAQVKGASGALVWQVVRAEDAPQASN